METNLETVAKTYYVVKLTNEEAWELVGDLHHCQDDNYLSAAGEALLDFLGARNVP